MPRLSIKAFWPVGDHGSRHAVTPQIAVLVDTLVCGMAKPQTPPASSHAVRERMKAIRQVDTSAEMAVRRACHRLGLRYRVDVRPEPELNRRADMVFVGARVAVFVDGCFWHGCDEHGRRNGKNRDYWNHKIRRNKERDQDTTKQLRDSGWHVMRVWEHEDPQDAAASIAEVVQGRMTKVNRPSLANAGSVRGHSYGDRS